MQWLKLSRLLCSLILILENVVASYKALRLMTSLDVAPNLEARRAMQMLVSRLNIKLGRVDLDQVLDGTYVRGLEESDFLAGIRKKLQPSGESRPAMPGDSMRRALMEGRLSLVHTQGTRITGSTCAQEVTMKNRANIIALFIVLTLAWNFSSIPAVEAQVEPFYRGKTVRIVVGWSPGSLFDLWARAIARHMGKHIPGNPGFVVQNMPGAGSMTASNYVFTMAKPDGLTLGSVHPSLYIEQLMGRKEVQFDWAKFSWIGQPEQTDRILYIRSDTPYKSVEDVRMASVPPRCGATGMGTASYYFPKALEDALGLRFNIVSGYGSGADVSLAIEKGEVQCWAGTVQAFFGREPGRSWAKTGFVRVLIQGGKKRDPRLADIPTIWELMSKHNTPEATRRLMRVLLAPDEIGRPIVGPPETPAERVKILRYAYDKTMNDPELLAEAKKHDWEVSPTRGEELEVTAKELVVQPPEVIEQVRKLLGK